MITVTPKCGDCEQRIFEDKDSANEYLAEVESKHRNVNMDNAKWSIL